MISTTKAMNALKDEGFFQHWFWATEKDGRITESHPTVTRTGERSLSISNETYGKKSYLYFYCKDADTAKRAARILRGLGGKPSFSWNSENPSAFEMRVSYFRGWHWWE